MFTIRENERAILIQHGVAKRWLTPGSYSSLLHRGTLQRFDMDDAVLVSTPELQRLAPESEASRMVVPSGHVACISQNELPHSVLPPGEYLLWQTRARVAARLIDVRELQAHVASDFVALLPAHLFQVVTVHAFQRALVFVDGVMEMVLEPGRHVLSKQDRQLSIVAYDLRETELLIAGQELLTRDRVTLRLNVLVKYRIVDPALAHMTVASVRDSLYSEVQLAAREFVANHPIEALLERQNEAVGEMLAVVQPRASTWGIEIARVDIKDVVLPGEMRAILNRVITAHKEAEANNILRREETAATRSLANTAKMLERNPTLMRLKELEAVKEIAGRVERLTIVSGDNVLGALTDR